jgi:hypothetical protein
MSGLRGGAFGSSGSVAALVGGLMLASGFVGLIIRESGGPGWLGDVATWVGVLGVVLIAISYVLARRAGPDQRSSAGGDGDPR